MLTLPPSPFTSLEEAIKRQKAINDKNAENDFMPGSLNQGWEYYFEWASKNHGAWQEAFNYAEKNRRDEEKRWREYYMKVYRDDFKWWKLMTMIALNGIQLWALWKQFRNQKEIAKRTYEIANRIQNVAEELFAFYKATYMPQEIALGNQINDYFNNPYCADYDGTGDIFEGNVRIAFGRAMGSWLRCSSSHCNPVTPAMMKQFAIEQAQAVGNARNGAYRYEELRKDTKDNKWLDMRLKFLQMGSAVSQKGQEGLFKAFNTFSSFGADPGAALSQLLSTFSNTVGQMINSPVAPTGSIDRVPPQSAIPYNVYFGGVRQSGDLQPAKSVKATGTKVSY